MSGRIVGIVVIIDVLDAPIAKRPYKDPWPQQKALDYIESQSGKHFDPKLTKILIEHFSEFMKIILG